MAVRPPIIFIYARPPWKDEHNKRFGLIMDRLGRDKNQFYYKIIIIVKREHYQKQTL